MRHYTFDQMYTALCTWDLLLNDEELRDEFLALLERLCEKSDKRVQAHINEDGSWSVVDVDEEGGEA